MILAGEYRARRFGMLLGALLFAVLRASLGQVASAPGCALPNQPGAVLSSIEARVLELRGASFPELGKVDLRLRTFHSQADYFRTRFSVPRFLFLQRMRYFVEVNPALFSQQAPSDGVCAVLAHELSHVVSLNHGNRIRRLSLVCLLSKRSTARFERKTDLDAIHRGYGDGLKNYRSWVYTHIPSSALPAKHRNYFSPEEIEAIQQRLQRRPDLFAYWSKHVPGNLQEILKNLN
jgi:hypothetical protein